MHEAHTDLILDVGNTRSKLGLFKGSGSVRTGAMPNGDLAALSEFLGPDRPTAIALGSVAAPDATFLTALRELAPVTLFDGGSEAPIRNTYATPTTLGADRLANVVAAARHFPGRPVLVVDLGTCITYDVLEGDGTYAGGAITPGMLMRAKAMNAYSARLPLVNNPRRRVRWGPAPKGLWRPASITEFWAKCVNLSGPMARKGPPWPLSSPVEMPCGSPAQWKVASLRSHS